jgi:TetR/AcrR family transcriptional repressor of nem operon
MLAAEHRTLPEPLQQSVCAFFAHNTAWLCTVLEQGRADGSLAFPGSVEDTAALVLGGLEGSMLITRLDGDVTRFRATAGRLLAGLSIHGQPTMATGGAGS